MGIELTGDANTPALPMTDAEVNHLRRLLAWMRCEWMLDPDAQRGYLLGASECVAGGLSTPEQAGALVQQAADKINRVPAYVRHAVKMLTKTLRDHERRAGIVDFDRFSPISDLVEMPDGTVMHKDDVPRLKPPTVALSPHARQEHGDDRGSPLARGRLECRVGRNLERRYDDTTGNTDDVGTHICSLRRPQRLPRHSCDSRRAGN